MKTARRYSAALALIPFLTQATGAADLSLVIGPAARPALYPIPVAAAHIPPRSAAAHTRPSSHFWQDASVVARWIYAQLTEERAPRPVAAASRAPARPIHVDRFGPAPEPKPTHDRMMLIKDPMIVDVAQAVRLLGVPNGGDMVIYKERVEGRWFRAGALRYRVVYKDSYGLSWGDADGFHFFIPGFKQVDVDALVPPAFYGDYPVYFHGNNAAFDIELENTGATALASLTISAQEELYDEAGPGVEIGDPLTRQVRALAPGAKAVVHGLFRVSDSGHARVNFEQTHIRISAAGERLAEEAHAGLVDPPNLIGVPRQ